MSIQAIFFDMGGTIDTFRFTRQYRVDNSHVIRECLLEKGIELPVDDEQLADIITSGTAAYTKWNMVSNVELPAHKIWAQFILKDLSISEEALKLIGEDLAFLYETRLYIREMRPEIPSVLSQIRELGLKIGCISNTQSINQVPFNLRYYGIIDYFNYIILSSVYGRRKPDPSIFYYASRLASVPTSACIYVGDKINRDILGSKRAGYDLSIQIKHLYDNGEKDDGAIPDAVIQSMDELLPILKQRISKHTPITVTKNCLGIKALFFDAGDILYFRPVKNSNLNKFLKSKNLKPDSNLETEKIRLKELAFTGQIKRHDYYEQIIRLYGITDPNDIAEGVDAISKDDESVEIINGVPETIRSLKQRGFYLGIITDTAMPFSRKLSWFEQYGFGDVWDAIISSRELGMRKPEPSMYEVALSQVGISPNQAVFIGHKQSELDGARNVGMHTIAFNYEENAQAEYYINQFPELLKIDILKKH